MQTVSCLLIHPNPESALNAAAGSLLQHDYTAFAKQAELMTSIHAPIPGSLKDAVLEARRRGEEGVGRAPTMALSVHKNLHGKRPHDQAAVHGERDDCRTWHTELTKKLPRLETGSAVIEAEKENENVEKGKGSTSFDQTWSGVTSQSASRPTLRKVSSVGSGRGKPQVRVGIRRL